MTTVKRYPRTILASACIPWTAAYAFDEPLFRRQVEAFLARGVTHLYVFGTAGEGYAVTDRQFDRIVRAFADAMRGPGNAPMVGLISLSFAAMIERLETAYSHGIRDFMFTLPSWGELADDELEAFFHRLCEPYPDCRFVHYNLPRSKRIVAAPEYVKLAAAIPNFAGVKYTTTDTRIIHGLLETQASPLQYFLGELGFGYGSLIGECGLLISLANSRLERAWEFYDAAVQGDAPKVLEFMSQFAAMHAGLMEATRTRRMDGAFDKLLFRLVDPEFPLRLLPPYMSYTEAQHEAYRSFLSDRFPEWLETAARSVPGRGRS